MPGKKDRFWQQQPPDIYEGRGIIFHDRVALFHPKCHSVFPGECIACVEKFLVIGFVEGNCEEGQKVAGVDDT